MVEVQFCICGDIYIGEWNLGNSISVWCTRISHLLTTQSINLYHWLTAIRGEKKCEIVILNNIVYFSLHCVVCVSFLSLCLLLLWMGKLLFFVVVAGQEMHNTLRASHSILCFFFFSRTSFIFKNIPIWCSAVDTLAWTRYSTNTKHFIQWLGGRTVSFHSISIRFVSLCCR